MSNLKKFWEIFLCIFSDTFPNVKFSINYFTVSPKLVLTVIYELIIIINVFKNVCEVILNFLNYFFWSKYVKIFPKFSQNFVSFLKILPKILMEFSENLLKFFEVEALLEMLIRNFRKLQLAGLWSNNSLSAETSCKIYRYFK